MSRALQTITLGREPVNCRCHVRAFFHSHEDFVVDASGTGACLQE